MMCMSPLTSRFSTARAVYVEAVPATRLPVRFWPVGTRLWVSHQSERQPAAGFPGDDKPAVRAARKRLLRLDQGTNQRVLRRSRPGSGLLSQPKGHDVAACRRPAEVARQIVVQEQRLVEAPRPGSLACAGAGESSRLQRLERGLRDPRLRRGEVLLDVTTDANGFHVGSILSTRSKHLLEVLPDGCLEVKELAATAAVEDSLRERACADARPANLRERDATSGSPATVRRDQLRGLWASVARAQPSAGKQIEPTSARPGDFPQAVTHLALISAPVNLDRQLG